MRPVLMMTAAVLLACVAYSHQQAVTAVLEDDGGASALNDGMLMREARSASGGAIRQKRQDNPTPRPTPPPKGNFDEIDLSGFPIGSG